MTPVSASLPAMGEAALSLSKLGHLILPLHRATGIKCTCSNTRCPTPGKHPRTKNGKNDASSDPNIIRNWWEKMPDSNVGVRTGAGVIVVDIDASRGGEEAFSKLLEMHGPLPTTPEVVTGGGGRHLYFQHDGEIRNSVNALTMGVDIRGDGGYVAAPPSMHASGRSYEWASGRSIADVPLATLPSWIVATLEAKARKPAAGPSPIPDNVIEGGRNEFLFKQSCGNRARGWPENVILLAALELNASVCRPPLDEAEVKAIVSKVVRNYKPGYYSGEVRQDGSPDKEGRILPGDDPGDDPSLNQGNWEAELVYNNKNFVDATVPGNAALLLANLPEWRGCLQFDAFANRIKWVKRTPEVAGLPSPTGDLEDKHIMFVQQWLAKNRGCKFAKTAVQDSIIVAAHKNYVHPLQEYLRSLRGAWDGKRRVVGWPSTYLGAPDPHATDANAKGKLSYVQAVSKWWMISAVARGMNPGCQADYTLILESNKQRKGKTSAARILGGEWYLGSLPDLRDGARAADAIQGFWIVEIGELDALRGAAATRAKDWLTQVVDTYRAAYARFKESHPRSCVYVGTTNENNYLRDSTGGGRYWPVKIDELNRDALIRDRDQLWAEAFALYEAGEQWHPTPDMWAALEAEQEARFDADPWEDLIVTWLPPRKKKDPSEVKKDDNDDALESALTTAHILDKCVGMKSDKVSRTESNRIAAIMRRRGYDLVSKWFNIAQESEEPQRVCVKVWEIPQPPVVTQ